MASLKSFFEGTHDLGSAAMGKEGMSGTYYPDDRPFAIIMCLVILGLLVALVALVIFMLSTVVGMGVLGILVGLTVITTLWIRFLRWLGNFGYKACEKAECLKKLSETPAPSID